MNVLLVEDSNSDATLLTDFLSSDNASPTVHRVTNGRDALDFIFQLGIYAEAPRPNVILLDLALPYIDGYEVLQQLKNDPAYTDIPVIVITTSSNPVDRNNCLRLGADAYFSKPFNLQGYAELAQELMQTELPRLAAVAMQQIHRPTRLN